MTNTHHQNQYSSDTDRSITEKGHSHPNNSFQGLVLGLSLALFFGGGAIALFFFSRSNEVPTPEATSTLAPSVEPSSSAQPSTRETTILREKTQELIPAPQATAIQPNININVPDTPSVNQLPNSEIPSAQQTPQAPPASSEPPEVNTAPASQNQNPPTQ